MSNVLADITTVYIRNLCTTKKLLQYGWSPSGRTATEVHQQSKIESLETFKRDTSIQVLDHSESESGHLWGAVHVGLSPFHLLKVHHDKASARLETCDTTCMYHLQRGTLHRCPLLAALTAAAPRKASSLTIIHEKVDEHRVSIELPCDDNL